VRFALFLQGRDVNDTLWSGSTNDPEGFMNEGTLQPDWWEMVADTGIFWCPDAPGPETVTDPHGFNTRKDAVAQENGIIGTSIVPNARFSPAGSRGVGPETMNLHKLREPTAETLVCGDGNELGIKTFSSKFRGRGDKDDYTGEFADPMWRHLSRTPTYPNRDQGWWEPQYNNGPPAHLQPRGTGRANIGFVDGHVKAMTQEEMEPLWEGGMINYEIE
jgi:prepilin-type processing-associated H-X9-DG protein